MQRTDGLRERKRVETRARIAGAALELALSDGLEGATVDAISAAAGVSTRTFHNYFDSKTDALLNMPDDADMRRSVDRVLEAAPDLGIQQVAVRFFIESARDSALSGSWSSDRRTLIKRHPQLFTTALRKHVEAKDVFVTAMRDLLDRRTADDARSHSAAAKHAGADGVGTEDLAAALIAAAGGAFRQVVSRSGRTEMLQLDAIEHRANAVLRAVALQLTSAPHQEGPS